MMVELRTASRPLWTVFLFQAILAALAALLFFCWKYPNLPKATFYSLYRDHVRRVADYETRRWPTLEGTRFVVRHEAADGAWAPLVLEHGERIYEEVYSYIPVDLPEKALLILVPDGSAMNRAMGWQGDQSAMGVYFAGVIRILSPAEYIHSEDREEQAREFDRQGPVAHELTHLLVDYRTKGNYSRWFTEGVAQYVESRVVGYRLADPAPGWQNRLYAFESMDRGFDDLPDEILAYRQSLAMVEYLVQAYGQDVLLRIMDQLASGYSEAEAIARATGAPWDRLVQGFQESLRPDGIRHAS